MKSFEGSLIIGASLLVFSVITSKASSRLGIPALLVFLLIGIGAGTHGIGGIPFTSYTLAQELGTFALTFILFSGGMNTELADAKAVLKPALILSTLGVLISAIVVGVFAQFVLKFSTYQGLLLGAIVASTDVAAVFSVLRSKSVSLKSGLAPLLELESALNDPMAVFLSVAFLGLASGEGHSILGLVPLFFRQMAVGAIAGWVSGQGAILLINRLKLEYDGLYPVLSLGWIMLTFAITQVLGGSGFLAVCVTGVIVGNAHILHRRSLVHFHEGIAWLGQIGMFLTMGLLIDPAEIRNVAARGIGLSGFVVFVARPISVFLSLPGKRYGTREKWMIAWGGLRGAVPIILASYVLATGIPKAFEIFNLVFFVTFFSVLLQGTLIPVVARWLKVNSPFREKYKFPIEFNPHKDLRNELVEISVPSGTAAVGKSLVELNLPKDVLVVLIQKKGEILVPRGATLIEDQDTLLVLSESQSPGDVKKLFNAPSGNA